MFYLDILMVSSLCLELLYMLGMDEIENGLDQLPVLLQLRFGIAKNPTVERL